MKYTKPPLSFEDQADLLLQRGLVSDRDALVRRLNATSYFRLSGYLFPFRDAGGDDFKEGTSLDEVWRLCLFDQRLRTLLLDAIEAIEAIEVYTRTQLAHRFAHDYDPFAYTTQGNLPNLRPDRFQHWLRKLDDQSNRALKAKEEFVVHFFNQYGDQHTRIHIWGLVELMDFGSTLTFYRGVELDMKKVIAAEMNLAEPVLFSWLLTLNTVRNRCAHHSRLWNWSIGNPVKVPRPNKYPEWNNPALNSRRIGIVLTLCRHLLNRISPGNHWTERALALFDEFPDVPLAPLGLPDDWRNHPLWK